MNGIFRNRRMSAVLALAVTVLLPGSVAQAQWYSSVPAQPPLYPYAVQNPAIRADRPYAVEVAPGTFVIQRPGEARSAPKRSRRAHVNNAPAADRAVKSRIDPALIEELRQRPKVKKAEINTTRVVRHPPTVIETKRYVDDPPRVIERYTVVEDENEKPAGRGKQRVAAGTATDKAIGKKAGKNGGKPDKNTGNEKRVIEADAEITIIGPDRMSIRLFRKSGSKANASVE